jgi:hypothetical protein
MCPYICLYICYLIDSDVAAVLIAASIPQVFSNQPVKEIQCILRTLYCIVLRNVVNYRTCGYCIQTVSPAKQKTVLVRNYLVIRLPVPVRNFDTNENFLILDLCGYNFKPRCSKKVIKVSTMLLILPVGYRSFNQLLDR